jgi:hypothetical protein
MSQSPGSGFSIIWSVTGTKFVCGAPLWGKAGTRVATNTVAVAAKRFMIVPPTD